MDPDAPILEFDPDPTAVVEPRRVIDGSESPSRIVLCFFRSVLDRIRDSGASVLFELQAAHGIHPVYGVEVQGQEIGVFHPGVGAPLAGAFFEEAIAHGGSKFVAVGTAGGLSSDLTLGHVVLPTWALRDEGTSYHYLSAGRTIEQATGPLESLRSVLTRNGVPFLEGGTWTTDGFYRETAGKVSRRVAEGCMTVEMEAAALFAIAAFRSVELGMLLTTSDDLSGEEWSGFPVEPDRDARELLFRLAAEAVIAL